VASRYVGRQDREPPAPGGSQREPFAELDRGTAPYILEIDDTAELLWRTIQERGSDQRREPHLHTRDVSTAYVDLSGPAGQPIEPEHQAAPPFATMGVGHDRLRGAELDHQAHG